MTQSNSSAWSAPAVALLVTATLYYMFEVYIPYVDYSIGYEKQCKAAGGFVLERQNADRICVGNNIIIKIK